jgi:hypothetical protein
MSLTDLHRRLLQDVLEIGNAFPLVITDGYAVQAHGLVDRMSRDIADLRRWAQAWSDDINRRLFADRRLDDDENDLP